MGRRDHFLCPDSRHMQGSIPGRFLGCPAGVGRAPRSLRVVGFGAGGGGGEVRFENAKFSLHLDLGSLL